MPTKNQINRVLGRIKNSKSKLGPSIGDLETDRASP